MFIVKVHKSCLVTYLGIVFGVMSAGFAFSKMAFNVEADYMRYSLVFLILSGICDMFDGKIARMCKRTKAEKEFGIQLDSLADTFNFVAVPVIIMLALDMTAWYHLIVDSMLVLAGVARLAYFNVNASLDNPVKYYNGLPVTSTAIIYPLLGMLHGKISDTLFCNILLGVTALISLLFVLKIKVPKLKGKAYVVIPILAAILITLLLIIK